MDVFREQGEVQSSVKGDENLHSDGTPGLQTLAWRSSIYPKGRVNLGEAFAFRGGTWLVGGFYRL